MTTWYESSIKKHLPDDTDESFYIMMTGTLADIYERAKEKWPGIEMDEINITSEYIHTDCLTHDQYDSSDWTEYLKIEAAESYFERITAPEDTAAA